MSDLTSFREYARSMHAGHAADCGLVWHKTGIFGDPYVSKIEKPNPKCAGECITNADRSLWTKLAAEIDEHLSRTVAVDLFGNATTEPLNRAWPPTEEEL